MKNNAYKYEAIEAIKEALFDKADTLRNSVESTLAYYLDDPVPEWAMKQIEREMAIADFIEDFVCKM